MSCGWKSSVSTQKQFTLVFKTSAIQVDIACRWACCMQEFPLGWKAVRTFMLFSLKPDVFQQGHPDASMWSLFGWSPAATSDHQLRRRSLCVVQAVCYHMGTTWISFLRCGQRLGREAEESHSPQPASEEGLVRIQFVLVRDARLVQGSGQSW